MREAIVYMRVGDISWKISARISLIIVKLSMRKRDELEHKEVTDFDFTNACQHFSQGRQ